MTQIAALYNGRTIEILTVLDKEAPIWPSAVLCMVYMFNVGTNIIDSFQKTNQSR